MRDIFCMRKKANQLRLNLGDIVISIAFPFNSEQDIRIDFPYRLFVTKEKPDVFLKVHSSSPPEYKVDEKVFDSAGNWSLYRSQNKYILKDSLRQVRQIVLDSDFKAGDIYLKKVQKKSPFALAYPLDEVLIINLLSQGRGAILHACGVSDKGRGLIFAGVGGAGKTTMANLWESQIADDKSQNEGVTVLSDDRLIIRKLNGHFWIYGTPWHGDVKICSPDRAPLERVLFLRHTENNSIKKISLSEAMSRLIVCSFSPFWDKKGMEFTLEFCAELAQRLPCYELGFVPDRSVLDFVRGKI